MCSKDTFPKNDKRYFVDIYAFVVDFESCFSMSDIYAATLPNTDNLHTT